MLTDRIGRSIAAVCVSMALVLDPAARAQQVPDTPSPCAILLSDVLKELCDEHLLEGDVQRFWREVRSRAVAGDYPFVEAIDGPSQSPPGYVRVTFLHKAGVDRPDNVLLFANINHVLPQELLFEKVGDTSVYTKTVEVPAGSRFVYRILENDPLTGLFAAAKYGTRMHLLGGDPDPLNPHRKVHPDRLGEGRDYIETWVELPGAPPQPWIEDRHQPRGTLTTEQVESRLLGSRRRITTYLPPGNDPDVEVGMLILFDASSYFSYGALATTLDNLIAEIKIPPVAVLGIDAGTQNGQSLRNLEFTCNPEFMEYLTEELLPWFTAKIRIDPDPANRVIAGSSFGGLFAAYFAFHHPDVVGNVLSQSGSFHWGRQQDDVPFEWLVREFAFADAKPLSLYLEVGLLEGEYTWNTPGFPHQIVSHRHFKTILDMKQYEVIYVEYTGGHEMLSWRGGIAEGLIALLGKPAAD